VDSPGFDALPRGRHRLTREQVAASQRERMLQGITEVVVEKGYVHTSVADVLKRAHVSRETFYEHFADKQACFLTAFDEAAELMLTIAFDSVGTADEPALERMERALTGYLNALTADPARARTFLIEIHAAGPAGAARRYAVQHRFVEVMQGLLLSDERWAGLPDPAFTTRMVVGGIAALVTGKVAEGDHAALPGLREPILAHIRALLPDAGSGAGSGR
jgi:AcrR family transcriptional regulator